MTTTRSATGLRISVLGPLRIVRDETPITPGSPKQRAVLAMLVMSPGRPVSVDRLVGAAWGTEDPSGHRASIHTYISNLRTLLDVAIDRSGDSYRLDIEPTAVDAVRFEEIVEDSRSRLSTDPTGVGDRLREALGLWRGLPYADVLDVEEIETEVRRLEELRLDAVELRIDADIGAGRHSAVVTEVGALAEEHPLRERFRAQHMLALYRSGRAAEALRSFRRTEEYFAEEMGVEPSGELRDLELAILQQDDELRRGASRGTTERLAILVTDIEDSTGAWDRHPQAMAHALGSHDRAILDAVEANQGSVFKHTGDGMLAAFPAVTDAVRAAEVAQRALSVTDWGELGELRVRMGIDVGEAESRGGDFFGPPLNRAARLAAAAHGGQVLISAGAQSAIVDSAPAGMQVRHLGEHVLRGFALPESIGQLVFVGLPAEFPELRIDSDLYTSPQVELALPGYELREPIGEGAFGVVYRAYQPSVGREVAIKVVRPQLARHPSFIHRFEAEARTIARLAHPRIVPLIDFWRDNEGAYLVLQLLPAGSLREALGTGKVDRGLALRILRHVGEALDHAHRHDVTHGDIKPANVLLDAEDNAYLSDFGIPARLLDPELVASISGDPTFRAPEEATTGPTREADLFSLGALARALLGDTEEIAAIIARATAPNPNDRYPDAITFLAELDIAVGEETVIPSRPSVSRNPFKGLRAFDESDAADFFGRDELVATLSAALNDHQLVAVTGPSGSGKSSVVRAGLLPRLGTNELSTQWVTTVVTPGLRPLEGILDALVALSPDPLDGPSLFENGGLAAVAERILPDDATLLITIDQFEELYTLADQDTRDTVIDALVDAIDATDRIKVLVTLRADFYDRPLDHPQLGPRVRDGLVTVLRPGPDDLLEMIVGPSHAVGLRWEPGLPHRIAEDVVHQPGGLPLLQYALTELVERRSSDLLTTVDYERVGGVAGALAARAETVFGHLDPGQQDAARQVLLRLVQVDEDSDDTRRRVRRIELESLGIDRSDLETVLTAFIDDRLLLTDRDPVTRGPTVEVAHEALLREWPRLQNWVEDQRESLILGRKLRAAMAEWHEADQDPGYLLTGTRLAPFLTWGESSSLSAEEERFFSASQRRDAEEQDALRRRRRIQMAIFAAAAAVAVILAGWALVERERAAAEAEQRLIAQREAESQRGEAEAQAEIALTQTDLAERNAEIARSRELAASAISVLDSDPTLSKLLALAAADIADPPLESVSALHRALAADRVVARYRWPEELGAPWELWTHLDPSGDRLVASGIAGIPSSHLEVVDLATGEVVWTWGLEHPQVAIARPRFVDDGRLIVVEALWESRNREGPAPDSAELGMFVFEAETGEMLDHYDMGPCGATVRAVSDSHAAVATVQEDSFTCFWVGADVIQHPMWLVDLETGERTLLTSWSRRGRSQASADGGAAFSGDGTVVAFDDFQRGLVVVVDVATGETLTELELDSSADLSFVSRLNHDGSLLAYGSQPIRIVDVETGDIRAEIEPPGRDSYIELHDDEVFVTTLEGDLVVYDVSTGRQTLDVPGIGSGAISTTDDGTLTLISDQVRGAVAVDMSTRGEIMAMETCSGF
ncbi:MAG TPA: BTAD domain-containing putative transcriptional regulator, partial [Acidimicrobiia bacterium]|nr:BTAD domain-containing putative transcriptional regulator [Acidimicrobiia bacterium]